VAILKQPSDVQAALVSDNPFKSCVPLAALPDYQSAYDAKWLMISRDKTILPEVRIFEFNDPGAN
jgi:hypothetical protein